MIFKKISGDQRLEGRVKHRGSVSNYAISSMEGEACRLQAEF